MPIPYRKPAPPNDDKRWKIVATRMRRLGDRPEALIEALHAAQEAFGFLDDDALEFVGDTLGVPHSRVFGVATFYSFFTLKPQGDHTCVVCTGTACYITGANDIIEAFADRLGIKPLYWNRDGERFRFASNTQALLAGGGVETGIDPVALHHYMSFHAVVPPPHTIVQGVRKVPPATIRTIEADGTTNGLDTGISLEDGPDVPRPVGELGPVRLAGQDPGEDVRDRLAGEERLPGEHLPEQHPGREQVALAAQRLAADLLGLTYHQFRGKLRKFNISGKPTGG